MSVCAFTLLCNVFTAVFNATCYFEIPVHGNISDVRSSLSLLGPNDEVELYSNNCYDAFLYNGGAITCFSNANNTCTAKVPQTLGNDNDKFLSVRSSTAIIGRKLTVAPPYFALTRQPQLFGNGHIELTIAKRDTCFSTPTAIVSSDGIVFRSSGDRYISTTPVAAYPYHMNNSLFCDGNGWSGTELCLAAPNTVFVGSFGPSSAVLAPLVTYAVSIFVFGVWSMLT